MSLSSTPNTTPKILRSDEVLSKSGTFYTSMHLRGDTVYLRGYTEGVPFDVADNAEPYLFVPDVGGKYKTLDGKRCKKKPFTTVRDAREFVKMNEGIKNAEFYGLTQFLYTHINDNFPGQINYDLSLIARVTIDIETRADGSFPNVLLADKEITLVTLSHRRGKDRKIITFGCGAYTPKIPGTHYVMCKDERHMLETILEYWNAPEWRPDIVTGWHIEGFDIPYVINRTRRVLGDAAVKKWSPWRIVQEREITRARGEKDTVYEIYGISVLDYLQLYKKFSFKNQEEYKLDFIANVELGEAKISYAEEYGTLDNLYLKNYELYTDYNIHDVVLVDRLDEKLKLLDLVFSMAYMAKIAFADTLTTTRSWDVLIHNYLLEKDIVVPQQPEVNNRIIMGGFVKQTKPGLYKWVGTVDLTSLYPHILMGWNISPETFLRRIYPWESTKIVDGLEMMDLDKFLSLVEHNRDDILAANASISGIGCMFSREEQGFIPFLMDKFYKERKGAKDKMLDLERQYEKTKTNALENEISKYHNLQLAIKIFLNSGYGALASPYFRWFSPDLAESITSSGQVAITWIERRINELMNKILGTEDFDYVIAVDTDSCHVNFGPLVEKMGLEDTQKIIDFIDEACKQKFEPYIAKCYDDLGIVVNAYQQQMKMKREVIASRGLYAAKKMYIQNVWDSENVRYAEPQVKMKGVAAVRSSTPMVCRKKIKEAYSIIMNKDEAALHDFVDEFREEFKKLPFDQVASPRGANNLEGYADRSTVYKKGCPIQVRGALLYNKYLTDLKLEGTYEKILDGAKIKFAYLHTPNPIRSNIIASIGRLPPEFELDEYIDYNTQFEKNFINHLAKITVLAGWTPEAVSMNLLELLGEISSETPTETIEDEEEDE